MENLKIKVNSEAESKEAQELFFELGFAWNCDGTKVVRHLNKSYLYAYSISKDMTFGSNSNFINNPNKEITLPQLRDLVVLKRNSIDDATHENSHNQKLYKAENGWYIYIESHSAWMWNQEELGYRPIKLKPIEKPMKEYLIKSGDGKYLLTHHDSIGAIEIPEGATKLVSHDYVHLPIMFVKPCANGYSYCYPKENWSDNILSNIKGRDILWSRHTLPEELPFIDDESYNHDYDGSEKEELESLNDQYAEIEKVRQTLNQRQDQYGSFEYVATATQDLLKILEKTGLKSLPSMHKEALHMICSKMVRIVNGDHNFIESWHDIAGYATLMENELRVTDGATNSRLTYQKVINGKLQDI